jgi:SNF2 family DNA or RNA helicase
MMPAAALHGELSADGKTIVLIGTGPDHVIEEMAKWLQLVTPLIQASKPPGALLMPVTWAAVVQLSHLFGTMWRPGPRLSAWLAQETMRRAGDRGQLLATLPPEGLVPRPYQIDGALMIGSLGRALLFDDPGTGKTITTILGLVERWMVQAEQAPVTPILVIAPASVVDPWVEAWKTWAPQWPAIAWRGSPERRRSIADNRARWGFQVFVTSYDTARMDAAKGRPLDRLGARSVVIDECHLIKSTHSGRSLAARRLARRADNFVALSGTPITHHTGDLWPALEALEPLAWPSSERYKSRYCMTVPGDYSSKVIGLNPATDAEFRLTLLGQHRRVAKADVLQQLPPKVYSVRTVELPEAYRKAYDDLEDKMIAELPDGDELAIMDVLAKLTHLGSLSCAPCDVRITVEIPETGPRAGEEVEHIHLDMKAPSWKVDALLEVLAERPGEPVVTFAPGRQLMTLAGASAAGAGLQVGYVVGGQSMRERTETVERFQKGKIDLLCATTGAGGVGLTLTAARTVVFLQRPWSLVEATQAEDRCHRIGSEHHDSIEIIDVVAANTVDARVRKVLYGKAGQLAELLQDKRIVTELLGGLSLRKAK